MPEQIRQIVQQTGVSADYINVYEGPSITLQRRGVDGFLEIVRQHPIPTYCERYPPERFYSPVTEQNRERVQRLDELATRVNSLQLSEDEIRRTLTEVERLVKGERR